MKKFLFSLMLMLIPHLSPSAYACTAFSCTIGDTVIVAKNYDWFLGNGHGRVFVYPRDTKRTAFNPNLSSKDNAFTWKSQYGSVTFTQFGKGLSVGGINEAGSLLKCCSSMTRNITKMNSLSLL